MWWNGRDLRALDAAVALYRASFTRSRIPDERVRALLEEGVYRLALDGAVSPSGAGLKAMALVAQIPDEHFNHLDYIATAVTERCKGIATHLLQFLVEETRRAGLDALTLETAEAMAPFYVRRGARHLDGLPYLFPSPIHGPMPMLVMAFGLEGQTTLDRPRAAAIVRALYRVIHRRSEPDPVLDSILERIPEQIPLTGARES